MAKIKVAFLGNSYISTFALKALMRDEIEIVWVITGVDQKVGRNHSKLQPNPVALFAKENNLPLLKTDSINRDLAKVKVSEVDYIITCSFGQFLSEEVLSWPKVLPINIHTSLLPKGRGGAPIHWAIINQEPISGISIMEMVKQMDAGDVFYQAQILIDSKETMDSLYNKFCNWIEVNFYNIFMQYVVTNPKPIKQDATKVSFWKNIQKVDRYINWAKPVETIDALIRGLYSKPMAATIYKGSHIKITEGTTEYNKPFPMARKIFRPGEIVAVLDDVLVVSNGHKNYYIKKLIVPGKKEITFKEFKNGNPTFFEPFTRFSPYKIETTGDN